MPLDGEQLNELLSGFVDGELTEVERALVEEAAQADTRVGERLRQLRQQSSWVQQVGRSLAIDLSAGSENVPSDQPFAQRVINAAQQRGREMGLPATHYVQPHAVDEVVELSSRRSLGWMAIGAFAAAAVLLIAITAITWPKPQQHHLAQQPQTVPLDSAAASSNHKLADDSASVESSMDEAMRESDAVGSGLVGKSAGMSYALVVDLEITADAQRSHVLEKILATAGIPLAPPVAANPEILKALDDSRLIVNNPPATARRVSIQVVRGDMQELDIALRKVWQDSNNFPNVAINLSIDSRATLMREILRSAGDRFAPTDRFAIPLAVDQTATASRSTDQPGHVSPFPGADGGVRYISKSQRDSGWEGLGELSVSQLESMATILLVTHNVE